MQIGTILFLLLGLAQLLVAALAALAAWKATRAEREITELHMVVNSRLDELVRLSAAAAHAAGKLEGEQMGRQQMEEAQKRVDDAAKHSPGGDP